VIIHKKHAGGVQGLLERIAELGEPKVYIGIPSSANPRQGAANNATIAAVHELGAPSRGIPARPFLIPTMQNNADKYTTLMAQGFRNALQDKEKAAEVYEKIGLVASSDVKDYIVSGQFVPLKESTIDRKGSSKPLIDSGELRNSISYEVRK
jgi:phage gpG-like protein